VKVVSKERFYAIGFGVGEMILCRSRVLSRQQQLSREEVIKAVMSKPATARFRTAFQYNNVMYSAVGECIGRANDSTWEGVISNSIFKPLGMKASNTGNARLA